MRRAASPFLHREPRVSGLRERIGRRHGTGYLLAKEHSAEDAMRTFSVSIWEGVESTYAVHVSRIGEQRTKRVLQGHLSRCMFEPGALRAGKSVRWVADQRGHADLALTLRVYAHAMRKEKNDLSFAEFGSSSKWLETALSGSDAKSQVFGIA